MRREGFLEILKDNKIFSNRRFNINYYDIQNARAYIIDKIKVCEASYILAEFNPL